jgi:ankyrin repeat protein
MGARGRCPGGVLTRRRDLQDGGTPLYAAAQFEKEDVVRFLVAAGADITAKHYVSERRVDVERQG